jgi:DNA-binding PadR family transcriptional regulator
MQGDPHGLFSGLIRIHVLHHAAQEELFGLGLIEELRRHGYQLSPGTLYPMLHSMEAKGLLRSRIRGVAGRNRRVYRATSLGKTALGDATGKVRELLRELIEGH